MMGVADNRHAPGFRKDGDEGSTDVAGSATTAVASRLRSTVSHPLRLEASPAGGASKTCVAALGFAAAGPGHDGHDLGGGGFPTREVRDGTRVLRGLPRGPQAP